MRFRRLLFAVLAVFLLCSFSVAVASPDPGAVGAVAAPLVPPSLGWWDSLVKTVAPYAGWLLAALGSSELLSLLPGIRSNGNLQLLLNIARWVLRFVSSLDPTGAKYAERWGGGGVAAPVATFQPPGGAVEPAKGDFSGDLSGLPSARGRDGA